MNTNRMHNRAIHLLGLLLLVCGLAIGSCSRDKDSSTERTYAYLPTFHYNLGSRTADITLRLTQPATQAMSIPYQLSGTAKLGVDFSTSSPTFEVKAGESEAHLIITRLNQGDDTKSLQISLSPQAGTPYALSLQNYTLVQLLAQGAYRYSFAEDEGVVGYTSTFSILLSQGNGARYSQNTETLVSLEVDPSSTAREGIDFTFPEGKTIKVPRRRNTGTFSIHFLKHEEGHDKLVLKLAEQEGFSDGNYSTLSLSIQGPASLEGTWQLNKIASTKWLLDNYSANVSELFGIASGDHITLSKTAQGYTLTPALSGGLQHYFSSTSQLTLLGERPEVMQDMDGVPRLDVLVYSVKDVNSNFSVTSPKLREAELWIRRYQDDAKHQIMEMIIIDYSASVPSWSNINDFGLESKDAPIRLVWMLQ